MSARDFLGEAPRPLAASPRHPEDQDDDPGRVSRRQPDGLIHIPDKSAPPAWSGSGRFAQQIGTRHMTKARNKISRPSADERVETTHHHYRIIAGRLSGECRAIAYLGKRQLDSLTAASVGAAVEALKRALDDHHAALRRERTASVPTEGEFREALDVLRAELPAQVFSLLRAHAKHAESAATVGDLARIGVGDEAVVIAEYGRLGRRLADLLGFMPDKDSLGRGLASMQSFAVVEAASGRLPARLRLRPQLVSALRAAESARSDAGLAAAASPQTRKAGSP